MYEAFMGQCLAIAAYLPVDSLNVVQGTGDQEMFSGEVGEVGDLLADPTVGTEDDLHWSFLLPQVATFVGQLPPRLRYIANQYYWLGRSGADIGKELGVTQSAISLSLKTIHRKGRIFFGVLEH